MKQHDDNSPIGLILRFARVMAGFGETLSGQTGYALVGLAVRPGCSVVANPKEVQGLIFNCVSIR
jgi:hypothetical protein